MKGCECVLTRDEFVQMSLSLNLFFLRIMKEHSFFLAVSLPLKNTKYIQDANWFAAHFGSLLQETVQLSNGAVSAQVINSGQFVSRFTMDAERASQFYTGLGIDTSITQNETNLQPGSVIPPGMESKVADLNQRVMTAVSGLAGFKNKLLNDVLTCQLYTTNYPLLLDHILREAVHYHGMLAKLQARADIRGEKDLIEEEVFWNRIMAEHAKFIRGLLDPTEETLFDTANLFGKQFDNLTAESLRAQNNPAIVPKVTAESLAAARSIRDFKAAGTGGILQCKIRSIILPLLADHTLREANHFIYILEFGT